MNNNFFVASKGIDRRRLLKGLGAAIALPSLETFAKDASIPQAGARN